MWRAALLLYLAGCNEVYGLDPTKPRPMDAREPCIAGTPFAAGVEVPIAGTYSVEAARFTPNRSVAYLSLCTPGGTIGTCDLYTSVYVPETEQFGSFSRMGGVSSMTYDSYPTLTTDSRYLIFGSSRGFAEASPRILVATAVGNSFDAPTVEPLPGLNSLANEPFLASRTVLYISREPSGSGALARMEGEPPTYGGSPQLVAGTDLPGFAEAAPVVREDELEIFFSAGTSVASFDIYTATRASTADAFAPVKVDALSTAGIDYPVWIAPDGCELYYINKANNVATLFVAKR